MNWWKVLIYGALGLGALLLLRIVVSLIFGILGLLWTIITTAVTLLAIGGLLYGGYKLWSWTCDTESSDSGGATSTSTEPANRVETLKERYANGELSEDKFERQLDRELDGPRTDSLDRKLKREHE